MSSVGLNQPGGGEEAPEVIARVLWTASRLWSAAVAFFFVGFLFAYVYLRTLNTNHMWHPHPHPSLALSTGIAAAVVLSAVAFAGALQQLRRGDVVAFQARAIASLLLGTAAVGAHIYQLATLGFDPIQGAYASVFVGWMAWLAVFELGAMCSLEMLVARSVRARSEAAAGVNGVIAAQAGDGSLVGAAAALQFFWRLLVVVEVVAYVLLNLVR